MIRDNVESNNSGSRFKCSRFTVEERWRLNGLKILRLGNWYAN
jgi:hypothetical protein